MWFLGDILGELLQTMWLHARQKTSSNYVRFCFGGTVWMRGGDTEHGVVHTILQLFWRVSNKKTENKWQDPTLCHYSPPWGVQSCFFLWFLAKKPKQKMTRPNSLPLLPPWAVQSFYFLFFIFFGFLFPGSLLFFLSLDLTLCQFSHFRGCQLAFGWFYYLLWACGFIRKLCKKNWQNAGITGGSLKGLGHKLGHFVCLCNLSKTVWNKCKNIGSQWMCRTEFDIDILGSNPWIRTCSNTWKIPLKRSDASFEVSASFASFNKCISFIIKMVEPGRASHWSRSCLSLLLCQKWTLLHMQCPFHNILS